jgi:hypothetical protein
MVMKQIVIALAALAATAFIAPATYAADCDPEDVSGVAECMETIVKLPSMLPDMPEMPSMPNMGSTPKMGGRGASKAAMMEQCGAENEAELKECMREMRE